MMKFTNSSSNNTYHLIAVVCTMTVLSVGVIFCSIHSISNETCNERWSAKAVLRRRLPVERVVPVQNNPVQVEGGNNDPVAVDEAVPVSPDMPEESHTNTNTKVVEHVFAGFAMATFVGSWGVFFGCMAGKDDFNSADFGCGSGIFITLALVYLWVWLFRFNGMSTWASGQFASGTHPIIISSICIGFGGLSISTLGVCSELGYVSGALCIGFLVMVGVLRMLKSLADEDPNYTIVGAGAVSATTVIGSACLFFGYNGVNAPVDSEFIHHTVVKVGFGFIGFAFAAILIGYLCKWFYECGQNNN